MNENASPMHLLPPPPEDVRYVCGMPFRPRLVIISSTWFIFIGLATIAFAIYFIIDAGSIREWDKEDWIAFSCWAMPSLAASVAKVILAIPLLRKSARARKAVLGITLAELGLSVAFALLIIIFNFAKGDPVYLAIIVLVLFTGAGIILYGIPAFFLLHHSVTDWFDQQKRVQRLLQRTYPEAEIQQ